MIERVVLVACSAKKLEHAAPARELYQGTRFKLSYQYAEQLQPRSIFILSARHGLVQPNTMLEPYEQTLEGASNEELYAWGKRVHTELRNHMTSFTRCTILAPPEYCMPLLPHLEDVETPIVGLDEDSQKAWLRAKVRT
jgi:hypothetical protein